MKNLKEFPFDRSRRITSKEVDSARKAIEHTTGKKRPARGRPPKEASEKYIPISIRIHPKVLSWIKLKAKKLGIGYQELLNIMLLKQVR